MIINIPHNGPNFIIGRDGREYRAQHLDGRNVVELPPAEYVFLTMGPQGKSWSDANPEAAQELGKFRFTLM
jgi:hypothetical protein